MKNFNKFSLLLLLLVSVIMIVPLSACGGKGSSVQNLKPGNLSQEELNQIFADSIQATKNADTYRVVTIIDIDMNRLYSSATDQAKMSINADMLYDENQNQMKMTMDTNMESSGQKQAVNAEIYVLTDYIYMKTNGQWAKVPATASVLESLDINSFDVGLEAMVDPASMEFLGYQTYQGKECYVIEYTPNTDYLRQYATQQITSDINIDWDYVPDISDIYKELTYTVWIARDSKLLLKMLTESTLEFSNTFASSPDFLFDKITTVVSAETRISNYGEPVIIVLPKEANNAQELSPDIFE